MLDPALLRSTFPVTVYLVTVLPAAPRPLIETSEKSTSIFNDLRRGIRLRCTVTCSASPLGLALNHRTWLPGVPLVRGYTLSRVMEVTLKRFTNVRPPPDFLPSR